MTRMTFNQLHSNRLNAIFYGVIQLLLVTLIILQAKLNITARIIILVIVIIITFLFIRYFRISQIIERTSLTNIISYWQFGPWKLKQKKYTHIDSDPIKLIQDQKKYYCIVIQLVDGRNKILEKYPTLDNANFRLIEFKQVFS